MATDNSSSLSKDQTIEQLKETIGQLEAVVQKLEEAPAAQLPSSESLQNLSTTTTELETSITQEVEPVLDLTTEEPEQEVVSTEEVVETSEQNEEQSEPETSAASIDEPLQEVVPAEQVTEALEQPEPETYSDSTEENELEVVPIEQVAENAEQSEPETSSVPTEPETLEPEALEPETSEPEASVEVTKSAAQTKEPVKQAVKVPDKQKNRKQKKGKSKNQAPKKKKGWLVGVLVAAIAVAAITLTLKFAPISELPQLIASNPILDKPVDKPKIKKPVIKSTAELPLESQEEIEEIGEIAKDPKKIDLEKVTREKIASRSNEAKQLEELTQTEPKQIEATPSELESEQELLASESEEELDLESDRFSESEEESEESLVAVEEEPQPITKLTSEQNLIVALGKKTDNLAEHYNDDLIVAINPDFATSIVSVTLSDDWYQLVENRQDRLLGDMFRRSQQLEFDKLMITDSNDNLIARSPVIGKEMVVFRRTS